MFSVVFVIVVVVGVGVVCFVALRKRGGSQTCCTDKRVRLLSYYYLTSESLLKVMSLSVSFVSSTDTVTVFLNTWHLVNAVNRPLLGSGSLLTLPRVRALSG